MLKKIKAFIKQLIGRKEIKTDEKIDEINNNEISYQKELIENKSKITELKKEYEHIFVINIGGLEFVFRPLTKFEFFEYILNNPGIIPVNLSEKICEMCVLYPEQYNFKDPRYAGIPDILFEQIKLQSGFTNDEMIKMHASEYRSINQNDFDHQMENIIMTAFPSITVEQMRDWSIYKLLDYFARAEWVVENMMPLHNLPGQEEEQPQQPPGRRGSSFFGRR